MRLIKNTRLTKNNDTTFSLYNNRIDKHLIISSGAAKEIERILIDNRKPTIIENLLCSSLIDCLSNEGFIDFSKERTENRFFCTKPLKTPFYLKALNIELTDSCNLRCKHCYGSFGNNKELRFVPISWFKYNTRYLDNLQTLNITLTGGECTLHPQFIDICKYILEHGFQLFILTNGYNYNRVEELLEQTKEYYYTIKISLDGFDDFHDTLRGVRGCFQNVCKSLEILSNYPNIHVYLSSTVMRSNLEQMADFDDFIKRYYPFVVHTHDLIFPSHLNYSSCLESFTPSEFDHIYSVYPKVLSSNNEKSFRNFRCTGGLSQCTLMPDGKVKICNAACDDCFYFKLNAYDRNILDVWTDCGDNINQFRKEKNKRTKDCYECSNKKGCAVTDCRILAKEYTGEINRSNPVSCYITKRGT